jgi:hypothetical protein
MQIFSYRYQILTKFGIDKQMLVKFHTIKIHSGIIELFHAARRINMAR